MHLGIGVIRAVARITVDLDRDSYTHTYESVDATPYAPGLHLDIG